MLEKLISFCTCGHVCVEGHLKRRRYKERNLHKSDSLLKDAALNDTKRQRTRSSTFCHQRGRTQMFLLPWYASIITALYQYNACTDACSSPANSCFFFLALQLFIKRLCPKSCAAAPSQCFTTPRTHPMGGNRQKPLQLHAPGLQAHRASTPVSTRGVLPNFPLSRHRPTSCTKE